MRKSQIDEISDLLLSYSAGDYHVKGEISENFDDIDMIISGINMLGEELQSTNVSKEYFTSIFNSVTDLVIVVNDKGELTEFNNSVVESTEYSTFELQKMHFNDLMEKPEKDIFQSIKSKLHENNEEGNYVVEASLLSATGRLIYGLLTCSVMVDRFGKFIGYLIDIKDITAQKENEKLILKTIISTQSAEQTRVADDLHDSLGQELSMAQLMVSNFKRFNVDDEEYSNLIELCDSILENSIKRLREICFDLMPNVLVKGGVALAVHTLVGKLKKSDKITVEFEDNENFPRLFSELEIVIYRIIQEFINNMIKHSSADKLSIVLDQNEDKVSVLLKENGQGFDMKKLENVGENRGISNVKTKVLAYNGHYQIKSERGKGTMLRVEFPKKQTNG